MNIRISHLIVGLIPAAVLLILWQMVGENSSAVRFFFATPLDVLTSFAEGIRSGTLVTDFIYTLVPTVAGFVLGVTVGTLLGFLLISSKSIATIAEWNVLVLSSVPIFAVAPMMLVWFGLGLEMKLAMAFLSTVFVALSQAYRGGMSVPSDLRQMFATNGAGRGATFCKLIIPTSLDWVFASLRLNANLALLGVFVGEYMASERGLGHAMLQAGSLYRVSDVLAAALAMIILVVTLDRSVWLLERRRHRIIQWFAVDGRLTGKTFGQGGR